MIPKSEKGQGAFECIACLSLTLAITSSLLIAFYAVYSKSFITYELQRAALCMNKLEVKPSKCIRRSRKSLEKNLWLHSNVYISSRNQSSEINIDFHADVFGKNTHFSKVLKVIR